MDKEKDKNEIINNVQRLSFNTLVLKKLKNNTESYTQLLFAVRSDNLHAGMVSWWLISTMLLLSLQLRGVTDVVKFPIAQLSGYALIGLLITVILLHMLSGLCSKEVLLLLSYRGMETKKAEAIALFGSLIFAGLIFSAVFISSLILPYVKIKVDPSVLGIWKIGYLMFFQLGILCILDAIRRYIRERIGLVLIEVQEALEGDLREQGVVKIEEVDEHVDEEI